MIRRIAPHLTDNPVFDLEARRLKRGKTIPDLTRWTLVWFIRVFGLMSVIGLVYISTNSWNFWGLLFLVSIGLGFLLDFAAVSAAVATMERINRVHLQLVHLTLFPAKKFIAAHHALAQLRTWRLTIVVMTVRVTVTFLAALLFIFSPYNSRRTLFLDFWELFKQEPLTGAFALLIALIFAATYIIEPLWRMKAVTALAVRLSTQRSVTMAVLFCFFGLVAMWISQVVTLAMTFGMIINIFPFIDLFLGQLSRFIPVLFADVMTTSVIYFYYLGIRNIGIDGAVKRVYSDL